MILMLVSIIMLTGCKSSNDWETISKDKDAQCATLYRDNEEIEVAILYDTKNIYIYNNDENHDLYALVKLPTDNLHPDQYNTIYVDTTNLIDGNSVLDVYVDHDDQDESYILYQLNDKGEYEYHKGYSYFYAKKINEGYIPEFTSYAGKWVADNENNSLPDTYLIINEKGGWELYDLNDDMIDEGAMVEDEYAHFVTMFGDNSLIDRCVISEYDTYIEISDIGNFNYSE